ncbi:GatB/YqeY domain-containing protein [Alkalibaculum sp. M08DMB]|uniref:GatB/YqeY domain-containing protein n=1 Tax=Alkalibaculum sporogenes TaxID=2655001 RepID=A0A6A7KC19_9FIRM|nr:GatB/YqeY domain-containing protein [Alkalibaculum sporogenes]MPW27089.1 GatB/YqeY domain-containing protein [Alkalibaculum sporogenes]
MSLKEQLSSELKESMKAKDLIAKSTIILVRAAILQYEKDNKVELIDEDIIGIISKQVKQRKDALAEFKKADRQDLVDQTEREIEILVKYLPQQLSESQVESIVLEAMKQVGADSMKDMGKIMAVVMPKIKGRADGGIVNKLVKENLN